MITPKNIVYSNSICTCFIIILLHFILLYLWFIHVSDTLQVRVYLWRNQMKMAKMEKSGTNTLAETSMAFAMAHAMTRQACNPPERKKDGWRWSLRLVTTATCLMEFAMNIKKGQKYNLHLWRLPQASWQSPRTLVLEKTQQKESVLLHYPTFLSH